MPSDHKTSTANDPGAWFWSTRKKEASPFGAFIWYVLRSLDIPFQYWLLSSGAGLRLLHKLGLSSTVSPSNSGLPSYHALILSLAIGSSAKQIYWKAFIGEQKFPASFAAIVAVYNTVLNGLNTLLALWTFTSQQTVSNHGSLMSFLTFSPWTIRIGVLLYSIGLFIEWYSEVQRKQFKADPKNQGKPYAGGLWNLATNINYGGYTLWRTGYALICGGWGWAGFMAVWLAGDFINRAIPSMDAYCQKKYGQQWEEVRAKVPYKLLPYIY